jgi:hypothetical protein
LYSRGFAASLVRPSFAIVSASKSLMCILFPF